MKAVIIASVLFFSFSALAQSDLQAPRKEVTGFTVAGLIHDCKVCSTDADADECIYCDGVLTGAASVLGMYEINMKFCPPLDMDTHMVRNFFRRWALTEGNKDPSLKDMPAVQGVVASLIHSFPCR